MTDSFFDRPMIAPLRNWWSRECGGREVMGIALPLVISTGFFSLMLFVDRMFLLWYSTEAMAAAMPAGMLHWTMLCFPLGVAQYVNTFVAQYHGANRPERIGPVVWQSARIGLFCIPLFLCTIPLAPYVFAFFGHEQPTRSYEIVYFQSLTFGSGAAVMAGALASFFIGRSQTRLVMYVNIAATLLNIGLDYLLIFGKLGCPSLGVAGAAWATAATQWFKVAVYLWMMHRGDNRARYRLDDRRFEPWLTKRLFVYGGPNGLQYLVEGSAFTFVTLMLGQLGGTAMAATTLAFNVNAVAFIPLIGVSIAVSTLVGQQLTRGYPQLAARATWTATCLALAYSGLFVILYLAVPDLFLMAHALGAQAEEFVRIREITVVLLRFVAAYCLFDAIQIVFTGAIKGAGDTWFVLRSTTIISILAVAIGWCGATYFGGELYWWWSLLTGWIFTLGVVYTVRFLQGHWKSMRVIEHAPADLVPGNDRVADELPLPVESSPAGP